MRSGENRNKQKEKILAFLQTKKGLNKLKKAGVMVEDDFGNTLPIDKILKGIAYNKTSIEHFSDVFGEDWLKENWTALLEILHATVEPDCLTLTIQDTQGNKIFSAYVNAFQLFGTYEYKQAICATIANAVFRTLVSLPTERELLTDLREGNEDCVAFIKDQLDYFANDDRNKIVLNLIEKNSPALRTLIKEKTGH